MAAEQERANERAAIQSVSLSLVRSFERLTGNEKRDTQNDSQGEREKDKKKLSRKLSNCFAVRPLCKDPTADAAD